MPLIKCGECGGQHIDTATVCPKCGAERYVRSSSGSVTSALPVASGRRLSIIHWMGIAVVVGLVALFSMVDNPGSGITSGEALHSDAGKPKTAEDCFNDHMRKVETIRTLFSGETQQRMLDEAVEKWRACNEKALQNSIEK